jgi:anthranilate synthase component 1
MYVDTIDGISDLLALHQSDAKKYPFLLESATRSLLSRYSILFAYPGDTLKIPFASRRSFTTEFDNWFERDRVDLYTDKYDLPFYGGWFLYLGYELAGQLEPTLELYPDKFSLPIASATRIPSAIINDHEKNKTFIVCEPGEVSLRNKIYKDIKLSRLTGKANTLEANINEENPEIYLQGVKKISDYIGAGDVFQVNLSRAWDVTLNKNIKPADLYRILREKNPAPFGALVDFDEFSIISSSPERLVRVQKGVIETRPIAGTRPRSDNAKRDKQLLDELINHPKERAEHVMLIDLERNDLGRICVPGTVEVDEIMTVESYQHVHHIVSNIRGDLSPGTTPGQIIRAVFPGGTITGCPKVRCMEIIAELEQTGRGPYTGSIGYINHSGDMDLNILIRTMLKQGRHVNFRTGAGIVYDSIPQNEVEETRHKAKGLLKVFDKGSQ